MNREKGPVREAMENRFVPKASVIIPTYNRFLQLCCAVESVLKQTYGDVEVIVVDDGSTDQTPSLFPRRFPSLQYIRTEHSGLPSVARNTGVRLAKGEYVAFLDSDDQWQSEKLAQQVAVLDAQRIVAGDGDLVALMANMKAREVLGKDLPQIKGFKGGNIIECVHAHEPGGCGRTEHCSGCALRLTVEDTYKTGKSHLRVPAYADVPVKGKPNKISFLISTEKVKGVVLLRIDKVGDFERWLNPDNT